MTTQISLIWAGVLLAAQLGAGFESGEVSGSEVSPTTMEIDLSVTLSRSDGPVVIHLFLPGEDEVVQPLVERGGRRWRAVVELRRADWRVVFEDVASGELSAETSLTELGLDRSVLVSSPDTQPEEESRVPASVAALLLGAAAAIVTGAVAAAISRDRLRRGS